ncbi:TPA: Ig-like domain-containing protein [Pseudomonas aeruginosa]
MTTSLARLKRAAIHVASVILCVGSIFGAHIETVAAAQQCRYDVNNYGMPMCGVYVWDGQLTEYGPISENGTDATWAANGYSSGGQSTSSALQNIMGTQTWPEGIKGPTLSYAGPAFCRTKGMDYINAKKAAAGSNWNGIAAMIVYGLIVSSATQICGNTNNPPSAGNVAMGVNEDTTGTVALSGWDAETPWSLSYSIVNGPANGSAYIVGNTLVFTPNANWSGSTSLTYAVTDAEGLTAYATVFITVYPVNDPPWVDNRWVTTNEDTPAYLGLYAGDIDSWNFGYQILSQPANGTAWMDGSTLVFVPNANWSGTTSLTYRAYDDGGAFSNVATVYITVNAVNDPPVVSNRALTTAEDTAATLALSVSDVDSWNFGYEIVGQPANGTAWMNGSTLNFVPNANWYGTTTLTYRAWDDGGAYSNIATVTITVTPVNDAPVVTNRTLTTAEDTPAGLGLTASDVDSSVFTYEVVGQPANGSATISGSTLTFTPAKDWNGTTSLTYRTRDDAGAYSNVATVTITVTAVNDPPVAIAKSLTIDEDTPGSVTLQATDVDSPVPTVFQVVTAPNAAQGSASISGSTLTFTPAKDWNGSTSLTYRAQDTAGAWSAPATVTIVVRPVNDPPVVIDRTLILDEDTVGNLTLTAADVDSTVFTFEVVSGPSVGTVKLTGAALSFTPPADWNGSTSLTYRVKDDAGAWSNVATVRITVNAVNDIPVVQPVNLATDEDNQVSVTLAATDIDSAPSFVFELLNPMPASEGKVTLQGNVLTFTPALDWNGATGVDYRARDTEGAWSNPARISITVRSVNDKPVKLVPIAIKTLESKSTTVSSKVQYYP